MTLADFDELFAEIARCEKGCDAAGEWNLAQVCRHLTETFNGSIDGFNLVRHRWKRRLLGKVLLRATYQRGIPRGFTADPALTPPCGLALELERARLLEAVKRYEAHRGRLHPHPLFGRLNRKQWDRLHLFHAAHHLSFLLPQCPN